MPARFIFSGTRYECNALFFDYLMEEKNGAQTAFTHTLILPHEGEERWRQMDQELRETLLKNMHLMFGISYWSLHCAPEIRFEYGGLSPEEATFWETVYAKGLMEFFYANNIDFRGLVRFSASARKARAHALPQREGALLALGGGKDSIVAAEMLRTGAVPWTLFSLGTTSVQDIAAHAIGKPAMIFRQHIDPQTRALRRSNSVYTGHLPFTALYAFTGILASALFGQRYVVFANEKSADFGNLEYLGETINHQWSKSSEFERLLKEHVAHAISPDIVPFSILRPFHEIEIVRRFSALPQYFAAFSSCNENFKPARRHARASTPHWCARCPKCAFVFACLAAFLPKETAVGIVGVNVYEKSELVPLFAELLGLERHKPFECIGTPEETIVAMCRACRSGSYANTPVMRMFQKRIAQEYMDLGLMERHIFSISAKHAIPKIFQVTLEKEKAG